MTCFDIICSVSRTLNSFFELFLFGSALKTLFGFCQLSYLSRFAIIVVAYNVFKSWHWSHWYTHLVFGIKASPSRNTDLLKHPVPVLNIFDLGRWRENRPRDSMNKMQYFLSAVSDSNIPQRHSLHLMNDCGFAAPSTTSNRGMLNSAPAVVRAALRNLWFTVRDRNEGLLCKC